MFLVYIKAHGNYQREIEVLSMSYGRSSNGAGKSRHIEYETTIGRYSVDGRRNHLTDVHFALVDFGETNSGPISLKHFATILNSNSAHAPKAGE